MCVITKRKTVDLACLCTIVIMFLRYTQVLRICNRNFILTPTVCKYSRRQYKVSVLFKKTIVLRRTNIKKNVTVYHFNGVYMLQFLRPIFRPTPPKSINRQTEAERATRTAETINRLERNWKEEKQLIDEKSINNRRTEAERASRRA